MMHLVPILRRYGLLFLWLTFGPVTALAARHPGFVSNPEMIPYPWTAAFVTWGILGLETAVIYRTLRWRHGFSIAFVLVVLFLVGCVLTFATDMAGYEYVPMRYQVVLLLVLGVAWVFTLAHHGRREGDSPGETAV